MYAHRQDLGRFFWVKTLIFALQKKVAHTEEPESCTHVETQ